MAKNLRLRLRPHPDTHDVVVDQDGNTWPRLYLPPRTHIPVVYSVGSYAMPTFRLQDVVMRCGGLTYLRRKCADFDCQTDLDAPDRTTLVFRVASSLHPRGVFPPGIRVDRQGTWGFYVARDSRFNGEGQVRPDLCPTNEYVVELEGIIRAIRRIEWIVPRLLLQGVHGPTLRIIIGTSCKQLIDDVVFNVWQWEHLADEDSTLPVGYNQVMTIHRILEGLFDHLNPRPILQFAYVSHAAVRSAYDLALDARRPRNPSHAPTIRQALQQTRVLLNMSPQEEAEAKQRDRSALYATEMQNTRLEWGQIFDLCWSITNMGQPPPLQLEPSGMTIKARHMRQA